MLIIWVQRMSGQYFFFSIFFSCMQEKFCYTYSKQKISLCILKVLCLPLQCVCWVSHYVTQASFKSVILLPPPLKIVLQSYGTVLGNICFWQCVENTKIWPFSFITLFMLLLIELQYLKISQHSWRLEWNFCWTSQPKLVSWSHVRILCNQPVCLTYI